MKLLTLNCHSWLEENQLNKIRILAEAIKEQSYDVIALQEVSQKLNPENIDGELKHDNFVLFLLEELKQIGVTGYEFVWECAHIGFDIYEEGVALLTKHPVEKTYSFFVTKSSDITNWKARRIVGAKIRYQGKLVRFYSCHLGWWHDEQESYEHQVDSLFSKINEESPFFLMGDFNNDANTRHEGYDYLLSKGVFDAYHLANTKDDGATVVGEIKGWDDNKEDLRIDLILTSTDVEVKSSKVIFNGKHKPVISDHYGIEVEVNL
ncbi:endonuclease/exonuclease/phosphatase family protein [Mesobacillus maritimus]|uniref:endonuclease/exonuclease/phosphatase family protein n=1 Tax=Mesobacillus maritimus TaxID=1643336 RepID=UPI00203ABB07|nr:endonuclease/exonuclease/phosphatase family protein [Mesobacillus maritimus]MCM3668332.1 endonuclease/exonuclease/phosphatase family protein [Mesobacillus maritimus]